MKRFINFPLMMLSYAIASYLQILFWEVFLCCYFFFLLGWNFIRNIGKEIPIRSLTGLLMALQMLIAPLIAYFGNDEYVIDVYKMQVSAETYFSYSIPAFIAFTLGLKSFNLNQDKVCGLNVFLGERIEQLQKLAYVFIVIGILASISLNFVPGGLSFYIYLLGCLKFVGLFILVLGQNNLPIWAITLVFGLIISSSLSTGMFHDLVVWLLFLVSFIFLRYKPGLTTKVAIFTLFALLAVGLQLVKADYRSGKYGWGSDGIISTVQNIEKNEGRLFSLERLRENAVRLNQGYILSHVLSTVPSEVKHTYGRTLKDILLSAVFPRFIYAEKLNAGDQEFFMRYSGMQLNATTSMGLGSMADMYVNFGVFGGVILMFFLGHLFHYFLNGIYKNSSHTPLLLFFVPLIFLYVIRPDCETQTSLGHLFKSSVVVFALYKFGILNINSKISNSISDAHLD